MAKPTCAQRATGNYLAFFAVAGVSTATSRPTRDLGLARALLPDVDRVRLITPCSPTLGLIGQYQSGER